MSKDVQDRVVVGVDSAYQHQPVIDLAVAEARRLRTGITIVHVFVEPSAYGLGPWALDFGTSVRDAGEALEKLASQVHEANPDIDVRGVVQVGSPAATLIEMSGEAKITVLGCRGLGGFSELLLGSVSSQVAGHARGPVIVLRPKDAGTSATGGPVIAGVDGSSASDAVLGMAFAQAHARGTGVVAMHCWAPAPTMRFVDEYSKVDIEEHEDGARRLLASALAPWQAEFPEVAVEQRIMLDPNPEAAFIEASRDASLVVVGSRGRGGFSGLVLGSVSQALLHHAHCPVAVVRG